MRTLKLLLLLLTLLPALVWAQPSSETDPYSIFWNGTTTTTARIPFQVGIQIDDGETVLWGDDGVSSGHLIGPIYAGIPAFQFKGGQYASGAGVNTLLLGGDATAAGQDGGVFILVGGTAGAGGQHGYNSVGYLGSPNKISRASTDAISSFYIYKALEVDGTTYLDGALNVVGTTTLATSLTGLLKATAGVVSTATAGTDYVHTLSVTPQILNIGTAADPNIAFDTTAAFNWSGVHEWSSGSDLTLDEDIKLHVGNNASSQGNLILYYEASGREVGFYDENGYVGLGYKFIFEPALKVNTAQSEYSQFGAVPTLVVPGNTTTLLAAGQTFNGSLGSGTQAGIIESYFTGGANDAQAHSALVLNHYITGANTLTLATNEGGSNAAKINYRHAGTAAVSLATSLDITAAHTNTGNTTNLIGINIEVPSNSSTGRPGTWTGIKLPAAGSGFTTTAAYGIFVQPLKSAYPVWFDGAAEAYFREGTMRIYSSAAGQLDFIATTTANIQAGTTTTFTISAGVEVTTIADKMTFNNGATDTYLGWVTNAQLDFGVSSTNEMRLTADNLTLENGATDTGLNWTTSGQLAFFVGATNEMRLTADTLTFENGATDCSLGWATSNQLDITCGASIFSGTIQATGATIGSLAGNLRAAAGVVAAYKPVLNRFTPLDNMPLATNYCTLNTRNQHSVLECDDTTAETAVFTGVLDRSYNSTGITITTAIMCKTATSGNFVLNAYIERMDTSTDQDADSFAAAQSATCACNGTSGIPVYCAITMTDGAQMDSLAVGEAFRLKLERDASNGSDTTTGDIQIEAVELKAT